MRQRFCGLLFVEFDKRDNRIRTDYWGKDNWLTVATDSKENLIEKKGKTTQFAGANLESYYS